MFFINMDDRHKAIVWDLFSTHHYFNVPTNLVAVLYEGCQVPLSNAIIRLDESCIYENKIHQT